MRVVMTVSNDLATDQRVQRVCATLAQEGHEILLLGRKLSNSLPFESSTYRTKRLRLWFNRGPVFYAELNVRLFFILLFSRCSVMHANDLDTLLSVWLISKIRNKHLVYDTHEYFTGVPEIQKRPVVKAVWKRIEKFIFPKLKHVFTVNESIADLYRNDYGNKGIHVMRNISPANVKIELADDLVVGLPSNCFRIILQGNGINVDRGGEEAVQMMQYLDDCVLLIAGSGDVIQRLKEMVLELNLSARVVFFERMPYAKLLGLTTCCDLGLSLDKDTNINYRFSLPNKVFDYLRAGIPVLASDLPEVRRIVETHQTGWIAAEVNPKALAEQIQRIKNDSNAYSNLRSRLRKASLELCWENECKALLNLYKGLEQSAL